jgi:hypothetical protein
MLDFIAFLDESWEELADMERIVGEVNEVGGRSPKSYQSISTSLEDQAKTQILSDIFLLFELLHR